jgi:O-antigen ligase
MSARAAMALPVAAPPVRDGGPAQKLGVLFVLAYLFFANSRILDFTIPELRVPLILLIGILLAALLSGNILAGLRTMAGRLLLAFLFLLCLSTLVSINRYQSLSIVINVTRNLVLAYVLTALLTNLHDIRRALQAVAWGTLTAAILGFVYQTSVEGERLGLTTGRFGDPNDYAMVLILGLPLWLTVGTGIGRILVGIPAVTVIFVAFIRTGSRGGLLAFVALAAAYFLTTSLMGKLRIALVMLVALGASVVIVPEGIQRRYVTIFNADEDGGLSQAEAERLQGVVHSSQSRKALLMASLKATALHPLLGVGPGNFPEYYWKLGFIEEGRNRQGMHTHNSYTQVSSEAGIPAGICFIAILYLCFRNAWRVVREQRLDPEHPLRVCGRAFWLAMLGWASSAMFLSTAWTEIIFFFTAMSSALALAHKQTLAALQTQEAARAAPAPLPAPHGLSQRPRPTSPLLRPAG